MDFDPRGLSVTDRYKLLIGGIVPRPIAWVSTLSPGPEPKPNLAPFSFFAGVSANPMTLLFCPANKPDGTLKDTCRNAAPAAQGGTGEFVVNIVPEALAQAMALCAEPLDYGESEWALAGLEMEPSRRVRPARVRGSPMTFECQTIRVEHLNPGQPAGGNLVMGEVVHVWVRDEAIDPARLHILPAALAAIGRMGGLSYCRTADRFDLPMGVSR
ncbi:MAG: flavin reductase family protein [Phycisphaerales bacterium]